VRDLRNPILIIIIVLSLVIGSATLTRGHEWGDDFASYIMQAQSILNGDPVGFIEHNTFTILESSFQIGPIAYPWGYPLILTPALLLKGIHPLTLKIPGLFFFNGFLICLYLLTKNRLTRTESLLLISLFAFNPILLKFLDQILSDIPFLFFIFFALLWITELEPKQGLWNPILGMIIFFAFFIRTTGIILLAGFLAYQAICFYRDYENRKTILNNSVLTALSFGLFWVITSLIFPNGQGSYFEQLRGLTLTIFKENISYYFYLFMTFFGEGPVWTNVYDVLIIFFIIGVWTRFHEDQLLVIFFAFYFIAMLFWPERQGIRFIFPLLPIFVYLVFQGIKASVRKLPERYYQFTFWAFNAFWLVIVGIFLFNSGIRAYSNLQDNRRINGPFDPYSSDVYNYIIAKTPSDSVIVFWKPRAMRLFTNRNTFMSTECDRLPLGDYVVISKKAENSQIPPGEIDQCNLTLENVFENQRFIVYEVHAVDEVHSVPK
jgi:hypothetical protein